MMTEHAKHKTSASTSSFSDTAQPSKDETQQVYNHLHSGHRRRKSSTDSSNEGLSKFIRVVNAAGQEELFPKDISGPDLLTSTVNGNSNNLSTSALSTASTVTRKDSTSASTTATTQTSFPRTVPGRYRLQKKIGEGSFGVIFLAIDRLLAERGIISNNKLQFSSSAMLKACTVSEVPARVAIKFEHKSCSAPQLRDEWRTYRILKEIPGIPRVYYYGQEGDYNVLVMELLGKNLEELFDLCGRQFSEATVAQLAINMITLVQKIHERGLIYRDIKPDNFLVDRATGTHLYLIDFGMAKWWWRDPQTKQHIPYRERKSLSGTARYMSVNTHLGREQSRRDDLESLGHVFFYFLRGTLPWQGLRAATNKEKHERIGSKKQCTTIAELGTGHSPEFQRYLEYCRSMTFDQNPDYSRLIGLMKDVLVRENKKCLNNGVNGYGPLAYDWLRVPSRVSNSAGTFSSITVDQKKKNNGEKRVIDSSTRAIHYYNSNHHQEKDPLLHRDSQTRSPPPQPTTDTRLRPSTSGTKLQSTKAVYDGEDLKMILSASRSKLQTGSSLPQVQGRQQQSQQQEQRKRRPWYRRLFCL